MPSLLEAPDPEVSADGAHHAGHELVHEAAWRRARETPDAIALYEDGDPISYRAIADEATSLVVAFQAKGLRAGDVISFQLPNWREAAAINIAASALGLVLNPIVPIYRGAECAHILRDARSKLLFVPERFRNFDYPAMIAGLRAELPDLRDVIVLRGDPARTDGYEALIGEAGGPLPVLPAVSRDAIKLLLYTSGTTGPAKGVRHSHATLAATHASTAYWRITSADVIFMPSPVTHITGYSWALELPFLMGVKAALMLIWDAARAVDYMEAVGATLTVGSTPFLQELVNEAERRGTIIPSLRMFACGGAPVSPELIYRANQVLAHCRSQRMYGSTEVPGVTRGWMGPDDLDLAATTDGRIIGWDVAILDAEGRPLAVGEDGEIAVRGPARMVGYTDPVQTEASLTADGYFLTGDIGRVTAEGALIVTGRKKDLIIRGGENLSAREIELVIERHPAVREAAVVAMPHARLGETVCAFVIAADAGQALRPADILDHVRAEDLARQKIPEWIEIVTDFPRTPSGKVRKDRLRSTIVGILADRAVAEG